MDKKRFLHWYDLLKPDFDIKDEVACENVFAAFDKNKDGTIDFKEFTTALAFLRPNTVEAHVDLFFQMYDVSGDGCLDYEELIDAFESIIYLLALGKKTTPKSAKQMASEINYSFVYVECLEADIVENSNLPIRQVLKNGRTRKSPIEIICFVILEENEKDSNNINNTNSMILIKD
ncbi:unnamed protein product [Rotaria sordida]|uniref:EF-hand domain-containing protein n=1 Tax=Rotaria sordida TaxID=392033 RepID=A0A814WGX7_9BILA|nr:unnamed protein product [Rotaria sordida]